MVQQPDFTETHAAMDGRLVADQEQGAVPLVAFSKSEIIVEKLLPEELAHRVGRLQRECFDLRRANRHIKQFSGLTALIAVVMTMSEPSLPREPRKSGQEASCSWIREVRRGAPCRRS